MQLFSADATTVQNKRGIVPKTHKKNCPCALSNWDSFLVWNFLNFEVVKLCRMKKYLRIYDAGTIAFHYVVLNCLYSGKVIISESSKIYDKHIFYNQRTLIRFSIYFISCRIFFWRKFSKWYSIVVTSLQRKGFTKSMAFT